VLITIGAVAMWVAAQAATSPLAVNIEVALCDVATQGVVPPGNPKQCDAALPDANLYWGAMYGVKTYLPKVLGVRKELVPVSNEEQQAGVRERFRLRLTRGGRDILITATAWADIKAATRAALSASDAGLVVYVGHNGLMDFPLDDVRNPKSAASTGGGGMRAVLACLSESYFDAPLRAAGHTPYVLTRSLMAPEAYVVEAVVLAFIDGKDAAGAAKDAGAAYARFQKISARAGRGVFAPTASR
jgi:hypothetical protein